VCEVSDPVVRGRPPNLSARHELRLQRLHLPQQWLVAATSISG
jgi:hypothetical protein